jgi:hypothetical protein
MAPPKPRRARNNPSKTKKTRQAHLNFAPPPAIENAPDDDIPVELDPTTKRARQPPPEKSRPKRWAWVWKHAPNKDTDTRYSNEITGKDEWRCAYCSQTYQTSSGTKLAEDHLISHGLKKDDPRGTPVQARDGTIQQPIQVSLKRQLEVGEEHKFKRRNMGLSDGSSIDPDRFEMLYIR